MTTVIEAEIELGHIYVEKTDDIIIKKLLTHMLIIRTASYYDDEIKRILLQKLKHGRNKSIKKFTIYINKQNNINIEKIRDKILQRIDESLKNTFDRKTDNISITAYDSIITNRNSVAHGRNTDMGINDLKIAHKNAKKILSYFAATINSNRHIRIKK